MTGKKSGDRHLPQDRKLGDEWNDWKGNRDPRDGFIDEKAATFLTLASGIFLITAGLLLFAWFMIKPRFAQIDPSVADAAGWILAGFIAGLVLAFLLEGGLLLRGGKSFLPYPCEGRLFRSLLPCTIWLGRKLGISKDRIGNSFIKIHNRITKSRVGQPNGRLLVLLPRCLNKEARQQVTARLSGDNYKVFTAAGGEEAREAIRQYRPERILAIACERDLMSGIKDIADRIPVIAIPNTRPEGPCKNTWFSVPDLEEALRVLRGET